MSKISIAGLNFTENNSSKKESKQKKSELQYFKNEPEEIILPDYEESLLEEQYNEYLDKILDDDYEESPNILSQLLNSGINIDELKKDINIFYKNKNEYLNDKRNHYILKKYNLDNYQLKSLSEELYGLYQTTDNEDII